METKIPFVKPFKTGKELEYIADLSTLCGDGKYTKLCNQWIEEQTQTAKALLTHSCTAALEMAAMLVDIKPGDEVIMPSYTFVSTANAFVLRGGVPVFVDIRPDTLNINEQLIAAAITEKTKAIVPVHYAGVSCEMDTIMAIAKQHHLYVIEDAAQGILATYKNKPLGSIGHLGAYSFHETKNIISGEGGALLVNDKQFAELAEIIREKGTDRSRFLMGHVDKYTWQHIGSSYLPSELIAAFLWAQLNAAPEINAARLKIWDFYHSRFAEAEARGLLRRPIIPEDCEHNAHMYYVLVNDVARRTQLLAYLKERNINAVFHYVPLHSSPGGLKYARAHGDMSVTDSLSERMLRLPLYVDMDECIQQRVVNAVLDGLNMPLKTSDTHIRAKVGT